MLFTPKKPAYHLFENHFILTALYIGHSLVEGPEILRIFPYQRYIQEILELGVRRDTANKENTRE